MNNNNRPEWAQGPESPNNLDLQIVQKESVYAVTHDEQEIAWFRFESDARIFVTAVTGNTEDRGGWA